MSAGLDRVQAALADRYRIERELGQGGMATVYLAYDLKHDRQVALKVLKPELAAVLGAERFVQEIKTTAALSHPHILPLFDSGSADGQLYYVMPYIEGETIREKLNRETQFGIDEAVRITREVADALDYAHRHGVIHRDIKPENILLHDGRAMVMDFGIALALSAAAGGRMTETGLSLGTPHYMSPEQATADKEITGRSDIYSLASVLYEMLAGNPPHTGSSAQQIIMKIVTENAAPITTLRKSVTPNVAAALARALEKVPADRFATAREFADALADPGFRTASAGPGSAFGTAGGHRAVVRHPLVLGLAAALVAALVLAAFQWRTAERTPVPGAVRFTLDLPPSTLLVTNAAEGNNVAVSPDGSTIAYVVVGASGISSLYVRRMSDAAAVPVAGTDGAQQPAFSPDGRSLAYLVGSTVWKIAVTGGTPVMVGPTGSGPLGTAWSASGQILVGSTQGLGALPAGGGAARMVARPDSALGELYFDQPRTLPNGAMAMVGITPTGGVGLSRIGLVSLESGKVTRFGIAALDPLGVIDGTLVYVAPSGALMGVSIDLRRGRITGTPVVLGPSVATTFAGASKASLSATGTLIYQPSGAAGQVGWVNLQHRFEPVLNDAQAYAYPRLSPDGRRFAVAVGSGDRSDVWLYDFTSATLSRLTNAGRVSDRPEWSPDGTHVLYRTDLGRRTAIWWQPADLSTPAAPLLASDAHDYYEGVLSPDGSAVVYQVDDGGGTQADVRVGAVAGDTASRPVAASQFIEAQPRFSPDGKWIAYVTDASGRSEVVVQPYPGPGGRVQVSVGGGSEPVWARDGRRLFYRDGRHLVAASVSTASGFTVTGRTDLFADNYSFARAPHANYDVSPDGSRFLMVQSTTHPELFVVYQWRNELRSLMANANGR